MTEDANHSELHDTEAKPDDAPPAAPAASSPAKALDVHPSLAKHVMSAQQAQDLAAKAVEEHDKANGKSLAEKIVRDAADAKAKMLAKLEKRHGERFSHSITKDPEDGSLIIHSFVMFEGTRRIATARKVTAAELEDMSPEDLVVHEAAQLHTLAHLTGA